MSSETWIERNPRYRDRHGSFLMSIAALAQEASYDLMKRGKAPITTDPPSLQMKMWEEIQPRSK
jgi:hypothetical protein